MSNGAQINYWRTFPVLTELKLDIKKQKCHLRNKTENMGPLIEKEV